MKLAQCSSARSRSGLPGLDWALNPYRGCSHGCAYCYAQDVTRFDMSTTWGQSVEVKVNFVQKLKKELERDATGVHGVGTVTDPYQPLEERYKLTRGSLNLLRRHNSCVSILTKSDLILRDIDILRSWSGAEVGISISCLDVSTAALIEGGAPSPKRRLQTLSTLAGEGVNVYLMIAPVIHNLTDSSDAVTELVHEAKEASVRSVMWDKFNPKPLATSRLRRRLSTMGLQMSSPHTASEAKRVRHAIEKACISEGVQLLDAF